MISRRPDKRVVAVWERTAPLLLVRCISDMFMYLSLTLTVVLLLAKSAAAGREGHPVLNSSSSGILPQIRPKNVTKSVMNGPRVARTKHYQYFLIFHCGTILLQLIQAAYCFASATIQGECFIRCSVMRRSTLAAVHSSPSWENTRSRSAGDKSRRKSS